MDISLIGRNQTIPYRDRRSPLFRHQGVVRSSRVVATLATAPLVALYFQVVSLLGILVNLVAIPLVLLLALPLGEAAVIAQTFSLTLVAQALVFVGNLPLLLGYQLIQWAAAVPGAAIITPTPTWLMIAAYYAVLILVFYPRRTFLTWAGAGLAGIVLTTAAALPLATVPKAVEVTCLDAHGGLEGVVVTPENRRLVVSAPLPPVGRTRPGWGAAAGIPALAAVPKPQYGHRLEPE